MLSEYLKFEIKKEAINSIPNECCGLICSGENNCCIITCKNISPNPKYSFRINEEDFLNNDNIIAYYHSHVTGSSELSKLDRINSEITQLPICVYSCENDEYGIYYPRKYKINLEGRPFIWSITDCASLVSDYFEKNYEGGFVYDSKPEKEISRFGSDDIKNKQFFDKGANGFGRIGKNGMGKFKKIENWKNEIQINDIVAMGFNYGNIIEHIGVYLGNNIILHHMINQYSRKENLDKYMDKILSVWRVVYD